MQEFKRRNSADGKSLAALRFPKSGRFYCNAAREMPGFERIYHLTAKRDYLLLPAGAEELLELPTPFIPLPPLDDVPLLWLEDGAALYC